MRAMEFAVDGQSLIGGEHAGIGNYSLRLLEAMGEVDAGSRYHVPYFWSPRRRRPLTHPLPPNVRFRRIPVPMPVVRALDRAGIHVAWDRFYRRLDACLFSGATARPIRRGGNVRVIYDVVFVKHPETMPSPQVAQEWRSNVTATLDAMDRIVAISESAKADIVDVLELAADRVVVAAPGVDRGVFRPAEQRAIDGVRNRYGLSAPYVLHVGTHEPRKNIPRLIGAMTRIDAARRGDLALVLAGHGAWGTQEVANALHEAARHGLRAQLLGYVPLDDLAALMSGAAVFAFPSLQEGFGMPVLEAMACGTPVVVSRIPTLMEVAGDAGWYADPHDVDEIAFAINTALSDDDERAVFIARGMGRAHTYSWHDSARVVRDALVAASR